MRIGISRNGQEIARGRLYFLYNDIHSQPLAYLEDVFVNENCRGQGLGARIVQAAIAEAKKAGCYKVIATSRFANQRAHHLYLSSGFKEHGRSFRLEP